MSSTTELETRIKKLPYIFREIDPMEVEIALTHSSFKGMNRGIGRDNSRYAFLGDAVINLLEADRLFQQKEEPRRGVMTSGRIELVSNRALRDLFDSKLKLDDVTFAARKHNLSMRDKATIVEALFGLLFEKKGIESCKDLWSTLIE